MSEDTKPFYINCAHKDDYLLLVHFAKGMKQYHAVHYKPHVFIPSDNPKSKYKGIHGEPLKKRDFSAIHDARNYIKFQLQLYGGQNKTVFGNLNWQYVYLSERYPEHEDFSDLTNRTNFLTIINIDIEVTSADGFPKPETADQKVTAITMKVSGPDRTDRRNTIVFGLEDKDIKTPYKNPDPGKIDYRAFSDESSMLKAFLDEWESINPDIVTGWYIEYFDIPYLINRINNVLDPVQTARLSVWETVRERNSLSAKGESLRTFDILGLSILDYMALYKRFSLKGQESYSLNHIAHVELKKRKLAYEEYGNLDVLRKQNYQRFIDYNIRDVELVEELDQKLKFIQMATLLAYDAKVNFYDVFAQTRMWDAIIYNYLKDKNIVLPPRNEPPEGDKNLEGAFVKDPQTGMHEWVVSLDLDSMYPSIMIQWNISPDTLVQGEHLSFDIDKVLEERPDFEGLRDNNVCLAPSGFAFTKGKRGFLPEMLIRMYEDRVSAKKQASLYRAQIAAINDELKDRGYQEK